MTITTSMLTKYTTKDNRTKHIGRLNSCSTFAFILGPSTGSILYKYVNRKAPVIVASLLFALNIVLASALLNESFDEKNCTEPNNDAKEDSVDRFKDDGEKVEKSSATKTTFWENIKLCCSSRSLASIIASLMLYGWMVRATSYSSMGSYYEDMYDVDPHARGYIQSYQRFLMFVVQAFLIQPILSWIGGERKAVLFAAVLLSSATFLESKQNFFLFVLVLSPSIALKSLLAQTAPEDAFFSIFAVLDVLQNATAVTVPFYRAFLFNYMRSIAASNMKGNTTTMDGDPDPISWVLCAGTHWLFFAALATTILFEAKKKKNKIHYSENKSQKKRQ